MTLNKALQTYLELKDRPLVIKRHGGNLYSFGLSDEDRFREAVKVLDENNVALTRYS